ncbi:hypothetical protein P7C73_g4106, partial [Tremellales sp. Uapishka_1]
MDSPRKKAKAAVTPSPPDSASLKIGRSGLRNEIASGRDVKDGWTKEQWAELGRSYRARATLSKRHGDAHCGFPSAPPALLASLPKDQLLGTVYLTDSVLLYLYTFFCEEQSGGRVRTFPYAESESLRSFVRTRWESEMRHAVDDRRRDLAKGMIGLMYLIEAVICYHLSSEQFIHLGRRGRELSVAATTNPSPGSGSSTSSPPNVGPSPASSDSFPPDFLPLITSSTATSYRAQNYLLSSRHHLSLRLLRTRFPATYEHAINSELSDEPLPAPGDSLGSARRIDPNHPERFAWPIELGMVGPVAHVVSFGRCLIKEAVEGEGKEWDGRLGEKEENR